MGKFLIKSESPIDEKYGKRPIDRDIIEYINKGVVNIDKPAGPTSHEVTSWVKKILNIDKAGHSGTLDPKVTGVLPILLGIGTKCVDVILNSGKEYVCLMKTYEIVDKKKIHKIFSEFTGEIYQKPPIKSAVKRQTRIRKIYYLDILEIDGKNILFKVGCQAGTYIRKLCNDIGLVLGCGARMQELRRIRAGVFCEDNSLVTLQDLKDAYIEWKENNNEELLRKIILPMEYAVSQLPKIVIRDTAVDAICHGAELAAPGVLYIEDGIEKGDVIAVFTQKGELVSLGKAQMKSSSIQKSSTGIVATTDKVFLETGVYPKTWK